MDSSFIAIWLPIFIIFVVILPQQSAAKTITNLIIRRKRGKSVMTNELVKKYIGRYCHVTTGNMGVSVSGKIIEVNENWIEIETKKGSEIINLDFIQNIKIKA